MIRRALPILPALIIWLGWCAGFATAQQDKNPGAATPSEADVELAPGNVAFFRVVNAIGLTTPTKVSFRTAAEPRWSEMAPGEASGMRVIRLGTYNLRVSNDGCDKPEIHDVIPLTKGGTYTLVVLYSEAVEKDGKIINRIQYSKLERSGTPKGPRLSVVSLIHEDSLPIQINGSPVSLPPLRAQHFDRTLNESITITHGGAPVMEPVEIAAEIPYLVFLFKNQSTGKVEGALAREMNVVLELPRSMQEQKEKEQAAKAEAESKDSPAKKPKPQP